MQQNAPKYIRSDRVKAVVNNKRTYYSAFGRNGILMPPFKDAIITTEFMDGVRAKSIWLPKAEECIGYTCVSPPSKIVLANYNA